MTKSRNWLKTCMLVALALPMAANARRYPNSRARAPGSRRLCDHATWRGTGFFCGPGISGQTTCFVLGSEKSADGLRVNARTRKYPVMGQAISSDQLHVL
jgi:hypothetical protein